jgi:hypothetical protein
MWLFTETGFVSAVQHRTEAETLVVRARDRKSLEPIAAQFALDINTNAYSDYPYRVFISKHDFNAWVSDSIKFLDYGNFKSQVAVTRGSKFAHTLGSVWATMLDAEDEEAHAMRRKSDSDLGFTPYASKGKAKVR